MIFFFFWKERLYIAKITYDSISEVATIYKWNRVGYQLKLSFLITILYHILTLRTGFSLNKRYFQYLNPMIRFWDSCMSHRTDTRVLEIVKEYIKQNKNADCEVCALNIMTNYTQHTRALLTTNEQSTYRLSHMSRKPVSWLVIRRC